MLHSICQQIWKTQQWPQDWKRSVFIPIPEKGNAKECLNYCTIALILYANKVMLKILQVFSKWGFNSMWTKNFQMFKLGLKKAEEQEIKLPTSLYHQESKRVPEKHLFLLYWLCQNLWLSGTNKLENSGRDGKTRPPDLPPEKSVCRSRINS